MCNHLSTNKRSYKNLINITIAEGGTREERNRVESTIYIKKI